MPIPAQSSKLINDYNTKATDRIAWSGSFIDRTINVPEVIILGDVRLKQPLVPMLMLHRPRDSCNYQCPGG